MEDEDQNNKMMVDGIRIFDNDSYLDELVECSHCLKHTPTENMEGKTWRVKHGG